MCIDHPTVQDLVGRIEDRRIITYGENPQADVRIMDVDPRGGQTKFRVMIRDRRPGFRLELEDLVLPMPGAHNALNATAAIAVAHELGVSPDAIRKALAGFGGVKRRFTRTGEWNGVTVFDDYGHHPDRDRGGAEGGARLDGRAGHRRGAAAPLYAPVVPVRPVLHLLQRCGCGHRRAGLCGGRAADPGRRPRRPRRRA